MCTKKKEERKEKRKTKMKDTLLGTEESLSCVRDSFADVEERGAKKKWQDERGRKMEKVEEGSKGESTGRVGRG